MKSQAMISLAATTGLTDAIATAGGNPARVLRAVGLDRALLKNQDGFIASSTFASLLQAAAQDTGDDCFGLHFGERFNPKDIGSLVYIVVNSPTVAAAFHNIERYFHMHNEAATVNFRVEGRQAYLRYLLTGLPLASVRQQNEFSMAVVVKTFRMIAGSHWSPREVHFAHPDPGCRDEHSRVFGKRISFSRATNALVVEHDFVKRKVPACDLRLYRILKGQAERMLARMPRGNDVLAAVIRAISETMHEGNPTLREVAKKMSISPRTLERRLEERKLVFRQVLDDTRRRQALDYLADDRDTITQIAYMLGYAEASVFNRAFKRWTGSTPSEYRKRRPVRRRP